MKPPLSLRQMAANPGHIGTRIGPAARARRGRAGSRSATTRKNAKQCGQAVHIYAEGLENLSQSKTRVQTGGPETGLQSRTNLGSTVEVSGM